TAALGLAGYLVYRLGLVASWQIPLALLAVVALTAIVLTGMRRSNRANTLIVGITLVALTVFVVAGLPGRWATGMRG
nr:hypothetical protein [Salinisphaera sp.]